jgi:hypothetical protein
MWCLTCGEKMQLLQAERADAMMVAGYEHHTWHCSACGQSERRLVFVRSEPEPSDATQQAAPDPSEAATPDPPEAVDLKPNPGTWERAVDKLRDRQRLLAEEAKLARGHEGAGEGPARPRSPAKPARPPPSLSQHNPKNWRSRSQSDPSPALVMARLAEKVRNRQASAARPMPAATASGELARFDQVWEGRADAGQPSAPAAPVASPPPPPPPPPLPRSVSLVAAEPAGQSTSLAARALALLRGLGFARRDRG